MVGADFDGLLKQAMGLDAASLGPSAVARAVQRRREACAMADDNAYWLHVRASPSELQELVEAIVVPETWFFRDREAFVALASMARAQLTEHPAQPELRLLSLPCSTGEEPLSMAIALLDAGIPAKRLRIDAVDISQRALEIAARARYGMNSFRGQDLGFRDQHFSAIGDGKWEPSDAIRQRVRFQQGNLFAGDFLPGQGLYDFIFCRNVLIYFDPGTQARALEVLLRLLHPGGCLFVGPSETGLLPRNRLSSAQMPMAFAFRPTPVLPDPPRAKVVSIVPARRVVASPGSIRKPDVQATKTAKAQPAETFDLAAVQALANQGRLQDAAVACERGLREHGPSAGAYHLLGLIRDAGGETSAAIALYRKALYLDPLHLATLAHLALLLDKQGNNGAAKVLRERLQRAETQGMK